MNLREWKLKRLYNKQDKMIKMILKYQSIIKKLKSWIREDNKEIKKLLSNNPTK